MKKIKSFLKKSWKYILIFVGGLVSAVSGVLIVSLMTEKAKEKEKENLIKSNDEKIKEIEELENEHEKIIDDSNSNYNKLINGSK